MLRVVITLELDSEVDPAKFTEELHNIGFTDGLFEAVTLAENSASGRPDSGVAFQLNISSVQYSDETAVHQSNYVPLADRGRSIAEIEIEEPLTYSPVQDYKAPARCVNCDGILDDNDEHVREADHEEWRYKSRRKRA